jgi:hypothetical protein
MKCSDYGNFSISGLTTSVIVDDVVKALRSQFEQSLLDNTINVADIEVKLSQSITGNSGHRYWFICPSCGSRVAKLYCQSPIVACRHCLGIKYRSSRYKGMIESSLEQDRGVI